MTKHQNGALGIRELRKTLSATLRQVEQGVGFTITSRNRAIAWLLPASTKQDCRTQLMQWAKTGRCTWSGGKPRGLKKRVALRGAPLSDTVLEDRR